MIAPVVKICGVTRVEDALLAAELGAAAIGFVFWPGSPRAVDVMQARAIARELPPFVATVGVFVDQARDAILDTARTVPLTAVQLHGEEPDELVARLPWRTVRALGLGAPATPSRLARLPHTVTLLLDAHDPVRRGGTGTPVDWAAAARIAARRRTILAGGLRPDTIVEAVTVVAPWGVDVSSGVESAPGIKDAGKLRALFAALEGVRARE
jgi:phosphoribosylanthranilate isomerase